MSHCVPGRGDKGKSNSTKEILMKGNILRHPLFFPLSILACSAAVMSMESNASVQH